MCDGLALTARRTRRVQPVRARVVEDHIEQHAKPALVCLTDELHQVIATAEARIDLEEVLDTVAVVGVQVAALPEDRAQPDSGDAQSLEIVQLAGNPGQCPALIAVTSRRRPGVPTPGFPVASVGRASVSLRPVEQRSHVLGTVTEPVDEQEVDDLVLPGCGRGVVVLAAW